MANTPNRPPGRSVKNLRMVWSFAAHYRLPIAAAALARIFAPVVGTTVSVALRNIVLAIVCVIILFALAWKLAALVVVGALLVVGPITFVARKVRAISRRSQDRIAEVGTVTSEVLGAMKI